MPHREPHPLRCVRYAAALLADQELSPIQPDLADQGARTQRAFGTRAALQQFAFSCILRHHFAPRVMVALAGKQEQQRSADKAPPRRQALATSRKRTASGSGASGRNEMSPSTLPEASQLLHASVENGSGTPFMPGLCGAAQLSSPW
jgi:hypothetical protein